MADYVKIVLLFIFTSPLLFTPAAEQTELPLVLVVEKDNGRTLVSIPLEPGEQFTLRYIHSVDISPVYEVFSADEKRGIIIEETYFKMFGAGMGHLSGRGSIVGHNGWIFIKGMDVPLGEFYLRIGPRSVDHTILIGEEEIHLSKMAPNTRVRLYIVRGTR